MLLQHTSPDEAEPCECPTWSCQPLFRDGQMCTDSLLWIPTAGNIAILSIKDAEIKGHGGASIPVRTFREDAPTVQAGGQLKLKTVGNVRSNDESSQY